MFKKIILLSELENFPEIQKSSDLRFSRGQGNATRTAIAKESEVIQEQL